MSCRQHGYLRPSLATSSYHSSPPAGLQGYILCPRIVAVCKFEQIVLLLHGHMWGSIGAHHLWAHPCFSSSVLRVLHVNAHKTQYMCYNQTGNIATLDGASLKLVDKFTYLGSSVSSTEKDIDTRLTKAWAAIDRLSIIWKSDLSDNMRRSFFHAAVVSILLYGCTTWTLTKQLEKKLDGNYTRMLRAILNKSWRQHPTRHQLYGHLPPITKTIQVKQHTGVFSLENEKESLLISTALINNLADFTNDFTFSLDFMFTQYVS